jgi:hypothetical protein
VRERHHVARFFPVIELRKERAAELVEHPGRIKGAGGGTEPIHQRGHFVERIEVLQDPVAHIRPLHLDGDLSSSPEHAAVHLAQRRGGNRFRLEGLERLGETDAKLLLHDPLDVGIRKRSDIVLQSRECLEVRGRQQIRACREELSQLDEGRSELFEVVREGPGFCGVAGQR